MSSATLLGPCQCHSGRVPSSQRHSEALSAEAVAVAEAEARRERGLALRCCRRQRRRRQRLALRRGSTGLRLAGVRRRSTRDRRSSPIETNESGIEGIEELGPVSQQGRRITSTPQGVATAFKFMAPPGQNVDLAPFLSPTGVCVVLVTGCDAASFSPAQ